MIRPKSIGSQEFDRYARDYDRMLAEGLAFSGEGKEYFAKGRLKWLKDQCLRWNWAPQRIMDFGCGSGDTAPLLLEVFEAETVVGVDLSRHLIERAGRNYGAGRITFRLSQEYAPLEEMDLVYCSGVFHHIPKVGRQTAMEYIWSSLRPGGYLAFWENNPWNPGTRYVMSRIPFDRDAVLLTPSEARALVQSSGFDIMRTDFLFIFPKALSLCRWVEPYLAGFPIGGQYLVLARKLRGAS